MSIIEKFSNSGILDEDLEIVCIFDGYEPRLAPLVIDMIASIKDERVFTVMMNFVCDDAYRGMNLN